MGTAVSEKNRPRKAYCITKAREPWTADEHALFLEALELYGRNWKEIVGHVGSRSVQQIRSHAQKFFLKLEKDGQEQVIPPPRPKKRPVRPYSHNQPEEGEGPGSSRSLSAIHSARQGDTPDTPECSLSGGSSDAGTFRKLPHIDSELAGELGLLSDGASAAEAALPVRKTRSMHQQAEAEGDAALGEQPEACGSAAPGGDAATQKNWAELYAIVGSLFDSRMSVTDHLAMLQHLPESQRHDLLPMLGNLMGNLRVTVHQQNQREQHHTPLAAVPGAVMMGRGQGSHGSRQDARLQVPAMVPVTIANIPLPYEYM